VTGVHPPIFGPDGFTSGRARYEDAPPTPETTDRTSARIWMRVQPSAGGEEFYAALDTGSGLCIMDSERATALGIGPQDQVVRIRTAYGSMSCPTCRLDVTLLADEGQSIGVEATFAIGEKGIWPQGLVLLGYGGMLERIRLALDPRHNHVYFGPG